MDRGRDRTASLSPLRFGNQVRSISRGRDRARSSSRLARRTSTTRARSQGEDVNYRWSILTHDPYERFEPNEEKPWGAPRDDDDVSEEEQISDEEPESKFDITEIVLPNFQMSIDAYYKKRTDAAEKLAKSLSENMYLTKKNEAVIKKGTDAQKLAETLALQKAFEDAKLADSVVPSNMKTQIHKLLVELEIPNPTEVTVDSLVKLENSKENTSSEYKKFIIEQSKKLREENVTANKKSRISVTDIDCNAENPRATISVTLGDFFAEKKDPTKVRSFIVYVDHTMDSLNALQYTIGTLVKSGDVIYVVNTSEIEPELDYYRHKCQSLKDTVVSFLKLMYDKEFKLHVVIQSTYRKYTKHFLNQLVRYLDPVLFVVATQTLLSKKLENYVSTCPFVVVKKLHKQDAKDTSIPISNSQGSRKNSFY